MATETTYRKDVLAELNTLPDEYMPFVLQVLRSFRESISLKPAADSFRQGWHEAQKGDTHPVSTLWDDVDAE